jgi:hypothetical protein
MSRKISKLGRPQRKLRRRIRSALNQFRKTGVPSEWLLSQCLKEVHHELRAIVVPGIAKLLGGASNDVH